jgi:hypothetical protein
VGIPVGIDAPLIDKTAKSAVIIVALILSCYVFDSQLLIIYVS